MKPIFDLNYAANAVNLKPLISAATDREISLIVALVIFIVLSVLLAAFVIMLFANKKFRAFFFGTNGEERKSAKPKRTRSRADKSSSNKKQPSPRRPAMSNLRQKREQAAADCLDEVPTVPLGGFSTVDDDPDIMRRTSDAYINMSVSSAKRASAKNRESVSDTLDKVPTFVIPQSAVDNVRTAQRSAAQAHASSASVKTGDKHDLSVKPEKKPTAKKYSSATNASSEKANIAAGKKAGATDNAKAAVKPTTSTAHKKADVASSKKADATDNAKAAVKSATSTAHKKADVAASKKSEKK